LSLNARGLTLIEVLAAAGVLGVGIAGVLVVAPIAGHGVQDGAQRSTATFLAEQRLEQVRNAAWTSAPDNDCLGLGAGVAPTVPAGKICRRATAVAAGGVTFADESDVAGQPGYSRTVRVQDCGAAACADIADPELRMVTVRVAYRTPTATGVARDGQAVTLTMIVSRR
jgi:hypothetical protein